MDIKARSMLISNHRHKSEKMGILRPGQPFESGHLELYNRDKQNLNMINNAKYTVQDIYNIPESYYKVARKRFINAIYISLPLAW